MSSTGHRPHTQLCPHTQGLVRAASLYVSIHCRNLNLVLSAACRGLALGARGCSNLV